MKLNYKAGRVHGNWSKQNYKVITACTWIVYRSTINHFNRSRCHFSCCCGFVTVFLHIHCRCRREMKKKYAQPKKVFVYKNRMHKNAFEAKERQREREKKMNLQTNKQTKKNLNDFSYHDSNSSFASNMHNLYESVCILCILVRYFQVFFCCRLNIETESTMH